MHGVTIQIDDLENDIACGLRQAALLKSDFDQFLIIRVRQRGLRFHRPGRQGLEQLAIQFLRELMPRARDLVQPRQRTHDPQRPDLGPAHGERLGQQLADKQREQQHPHHRPAERPVTFERHPQSDRQHAGVGERVAQHHRGEQVLRLVEQPSRQRSGAFLPGREQPHLPLAQGEERRFRQCKKATRPGANQDQHGSKDWRNFHTAIMKKSRPGKK